MTHELGFFTLGCTNCRRTFELPSLGDMNYGERILHGERGSVHRYVCVLDHPVWSVIAAALGPRVPEGSPQWWQALAAVADPVEGQRLRTEPICPHCQADRTHFQTPKRGVKTRRVGLVEDATFEVLLSLPPDEQRRRVTAAAGEA